MKGYIIPCLLGLASIALMDGCAPERSTEASTMLGRADTLIQEGRYDEALQLIDRARESAPANSEILKQTTKLKRTLRYNEAESKLVALDSVMSNQDEEIRQRLKGFVTLQNANYDTPVRYTHPSLEASRLGRKPHLRAVVDTAGVLQLISVYVGGNSPKHSAIELSFVGGSKDSTLRLPDIPYDESLNYRYTDDDSHWELVTYTDMMLEPAVAYLEQGLGKGGRLQVCFLSSSRVVYKYLMPTAEAIGLKKTLELMRLLEHRNELRKEQAKYARRFVRLAEREE